MWVEVPSAPFRQTLLFQDERATPAVSTLLKETRVGRMIFLAPPELEEEGGDEEVIKSKPQRWEGKKWRERKDVFFFCLLYIFSSSFLCPFLCLFSHREEGEGPP